MVRLRWVRWSHLSSSRLGRVENTLRPWEWQWSNRSVNGLEEAGCNEYIARVKCRGQAL